MKRKQRERDSREPVNTQEIEAAIRKDGKMKMKSKKIENMAIHSLLMEKEKEVDHFIAVRKVETMGSAKS